MTPAPAASRSLATRNTSIAMKGGTIPRRDARSVMPSILREKLGIGERLSL
jgi:hypothetical protein